ncbi:ATP-binding protein [Actibacterium pelagium]|uniref:histidine kinase n=1 Tax=Actibacterium pelagium TaxID=2029103 RepID=A0A917AC46_9RHOB|nr:ATP-binding protein [Actibacterium pelagium]GGE42586.1 two-component sensor histidine kinase [Actibacterium pelagium]
MTQTIPVDVLDALPVPVVLVSGRERVSAMNKQAEELFGTGSVGRHFITVLRHPELLDCVEDTLRLQQVRKVRFLTSEVNREATYNVTASPVADGTSWGAAVVFEDVTEREQAGQIRRDFVANVSHELKTPLTALLGFIETLRGPAKDDAAARDRFLGIMEKEAERMNRLVRDLLQLSRVESEERMRPDEKVDVSGLLKSTITGLRKLSLDHGNEVELIGAKNEVFVRGDPDQLTQVFTNLIENGIKYGKVGGLVQVRLVKVEREIAFRGPAVHIEVMDDGEGFDPVHIPRLTERFYRVDSHRSREKGGTGLGLAIVKHIVNRHRGRFRIESKPGKGSKFTVILPMT